MSGSASGGGCFPTAQQELLLRAALLEREPAIGAWERWKRLTGGVEHHDHASYRVLPLLYRRLSSFGLDDDPQVRKLKGVYRHCWYCNQRLFHEAEGVLEQFAGAGIPTLVLKGAALTQLYYRDLGARPMADLDILVPADRAGEAFEMLGGSGWSEKTGVPFETLRFTHHSTGFIDGRGRELDLHWNALWHPATDDDFWAAAVPVSVREAPTLALCPTDQLLHVTVHGTGWFGAPVSWVLDAMTVLTAASEEIDWERLVERAAERRLTLPLVAALRYLGATFEAPIPPETIELLEASKPTARERLTHRVVVRPPKHGGAYLLEWDRWRRLRELDPASRAPAGFAAYMQASWRLRSRRELAHRLLRKAGQIAAHGRSHPSGEQLAVTRDGG